MLKCCGTVESKELSRGGGGEEGTHVECITASHYHVNCAREPLAERAYRHGDSRLEYVLSAISSTNTTRLILSQRRNPKKDPMVGDCGPRQLDTGTCNERRANSLEDR